MTEKENTNISRLNINDKEIILIGTAHVSKESADLVVETIESEKPDTVCVELCSSRYQAISQKDKWQNMDIVKVIKEKKAFLLLSNLMLSSFQKKIADKFGIKPGQEMISAIQSAEETGAAIELADRDVQVTLSRVWRLMGLWEKMKIMFQLLLSSFSDADEISEEDIEKMKQQDTLESILSEVGKSHPVVKQSLITERDVYLSQKIKNAPGNKIVAAVGAGHVPGILEYIHQDIDINPLMDIPPKGKAGTILKWGIPSVIIIAIIAGFFYGGANAGKEMIWWWIGANGILAGLGALAALAHPLTIVSSVIAAPLTSLNPMIAAGWVSGLVEAFTRKPKVKDLESLPKDVLTVKGFWKNSVTRILLVVVFTNLGSTLGTFVALPFMLKVFGS